MGFFQKTKVTFDKGIKCKSHIYIVFSTGFYIAHPRFLCKIRCLLMVDDPVVLKIAFVPDDHNYAGLVGV